MQVETTARLLLSNGDYAIVDADLIEELSKFKWHRSTSRGYVIRNLSQKCGARGSEYLHIRVNCTPKGLKTDHINLNVLDNRRSNLRTVTDQQNFWNQGKRRTPTTSKFKGVSWDRRRNKWKASIFAAGKSLHIGRFDVESVAALAYNSFARQIFGHFAHLNKME